MLWMRNQKLRGSSNFSKVIWPGSQCEGQAPEAEPVSPKPAAFVKRLPSSWHWKQTPVQWSVVSCILALTGAVDL